MHNIRGLRYRLRQLATAAAVLSLCAAGPAIADTTGVDANSLAPASTSLDCGGGITAITLTPASGFDPLTATDEELEDNGLPERPDGGDADELATWTTYVTEAHKATACPKESSDHTTGGPSARSEVITTGADGDADPDVDVNSPVDFVNTDTGDDADLGADTTGTNGGHSANWTGNIATGHTYTYAKARWKVPSVYVPGDDKAYYSSSWVGIGQGNSKSKPLVQDGSESDGHNGVYSHYAIWWEVYPQNHSQVVSTDVYKGDSIFASVSFHANSARFNITDETSNEGGIYTYTSGTFSPDGTAEWVYERPDVDGYYTHLAYATTTFTDAYAEYGSTMKSLGNLTHNYVTMWNCTSAAKTRLAYPGAITSSGTKFTAHWQAYGARSKASSCSVWS